MVAEGDYKKILELVATWPLEDRAALARDVLAVRPPTPANTARRPSFAEAYGLFRVPGQPAPTDEQVRQWIDEHRMRKYGQ
jgi:hypothetical protein